MRPKPAALDPSALKLPVEAIQGRSALPNVTFALLSPVAASPSRAATIATSGNRGFMSCRSTMETSPRSVSTFAPSWVSPSGSPGSPVSAVNTIRTSGATSMQQIVLVRAVTAPVTHHTPVAAASASSPVAAATAGGLRLPLAAATPASPKVPLGHAPGFTPLTRSVTVTLSTPMAQPSPAVATPMATPGGILRKYGPAQGIPFPPGMGFTPAAQSMKRTISFGLSAQGAPLLRTSSKVGEVPEETQEEESVAEGVLPREFLLCFRDHVGTDHASAAEAGFLWPQPGWIRTEHSEKPAPAAQAEATGKTRQGRLPGNKTNNRPAVDERAEAAADAGGTASAQDGKYVQNTQTSKQNGHHQTWWKDPHGGWWYQSSTGEWVQQQQQQQWQQHAQAPQPVKTQVQYQQPPRQYQGQPQYHQHQQHYAYQHGQQAAAVTGKGNGKGQTSGAKGGWGK